MDSWRTAWKKSPYRGTCFDGTILLHWILISRSWLSFPHVPEPAIMATVSQGQVPQGQIQSHSQQHQQLTKPPMSKWWWISFLTTSLIVVVIAGALLGVGLDPSNTLTIDEQYTMLITSWSLFGLGFIFHIVFWILWAVRRSQAKRLQPQNHTIVYLDAAGRPYATTTTTTTTAIPHIYIPPAINNPTTPAPAPQYPVPTKYPAVQHRPQSLAQTASTRSVKTQSVTGQYAGAELGTTAPQSQPTELALQQPSHLTRIELGAQQRAEMAATPVSMSHYSRGVEY